MSYFIMFNFKSTLSNYQIHCLGFSLNHADIHTVHFCRISTDGDHARIVDVRSLFTWSATTATAQGTRHNIDIASYL